MDYGEFSGRDLDWDAASGRWMLSERERGSVTWDTGLQPMDSDLEELRDFFLVPDAVATSELVAMSPADLVAAHAQEHATSLLRLRECTSCDGHWDVYRRDGDQWLFFGGDCTGQRAYGSPVGENEAKI